MDWTDKKDTLILFLKKYRWAAVVLAVGILLMSLPEAGSSRKETTLPTKEPQAAEDSFQQELEKLLSSMEGAGRVKLLLSVSSGPENHYQTDEDFSASGDSSDRRRETVLVTSADRNQTGLLRRTDPPRYLGAVVLCQGADSPAVKLAVVDAVATATGLTSDKIAVWKMK